MQVPETPAISPEDSPDFEAEPVVPVSLAPGQRFDTVLHADVKYFQQLKSAGTDLSVLRARSCWTLTQLQWSPAQCLERWGRYLHIHSGHPILLSASPCSAKIASQR